MAHVMYSPFAGWAFETPHVIRDIAHWCHDNCEGYWRLGETDTMFFLEHDDAVLFMMTHGKRNEIP